MIRDGYEIRDANGAVCAHSPTMKLAWVELRRMRRLYPGRAFLAVDLLDPGRDCEPDPEYDPEEQRAADDALLPFCACGRAWSECDGSRRGCRKRVSR